MAAKFKDAWNTRTGKKLQHRVPESHFKLFPHLSPTPTQKSRDRRQADSARPTEGEN